MQLRVQVSPNYSSLILMMYTGANVMPVDIWVINSMGEPVLLLQVNVVEWCPIVYFSLLNSVHRVLQATNMPSNKQHRPPRPQSGASSNWQKFNHKGGKLQLRHEECPWFNISSRGPQGIQGRSLGIRRLPMPTTSPEKPSVDESEALSLACLEIYLELRTFPVYSLQMSSQIWQSISLCLHRQDFLHTTEIHTLGHEFAEE